MKAQKNARKRRLSSPAENQQYMDVPSLSISHGVVSVGRESAMLLMRPVSRDDIKDKWDYIGFTALRATGLDLRRMKCKLGGDSQISQRGRATFG
ncbi:hypothetical protein QQF64_008816 [Cirrhinus molitorella]|uniref:Uncharacterized protein n=1 Tax=Cirrhinus molitorella TaxID=172907 RepID=A0ABR3M799_9TELE